MFMLCILYFRTELGLQSAYPKTFTSTQTPLNLQVSHVHIYSTVYSTRTMTFVCICICLFFFFLHLSLISSCVSQWGLSGNPDAKLAFQQPFPPCLPQLPNVPHTVFTLLSSPAHILFLPIPTPLHYCGAVQQAKFGEVYAYKTLP